MFKRTLIVLEPRLRLEAVVMRCSAIARACAGEVVFFTRVKRARSTAAVAPATESTASSETPDDEHRQAQRLHRHAAQIARASGVRSRSVISTTENAVKDILRTVSAQRCDAIVLVSEGGSAVARLFNGSSIPGLITASPVPVLVCPASAARHPAEAVGMSRLLVQLESGDVTDAALKAGLDLARELDADVLLGQITPADCVPIVDPLGHVWCMSERLSEDIQVQPRRLLARATALAAKAGVASTALSLPVGAAAKDVARAAVRGACDLIVVAHRGGNAVLRLLNASLIPGLISAAQTPILICRASEQVPPRRRPRRPHRRHRGIAAAPVVPDRHHRAA